MRIILTSLASTSWRQLWSFLREIIDDDAALAELTVLDGSVFSSGELPAGPKPNRSDLRCAEYPILDVTGLPFGR